MKIDHHDIAVKNKLAEAFAHNMAAKASWRRNYVAVAQCIGHAGRRHDLIGYSESRTVGAQSSARVL